MASNNYTVRIDTDVKQQAEALFDELGVTFSAAVNIFLRAALREGGFPFDIRTSKPSKETIAAMLEAERIAKDPSVKGFNSVDELFADLNE